MVSNGKEQEDMERHVNSSTTTSSSTVHMSAQSEAVSAFDFRLTALSRVACEGDLRRRSVWVYPPSWQQSNLALLSSLPTRRFQCGDRPLIMRFSFLTATSIAAAALSSSAVWAVVINPPSPQSLPSNHRETVQEAAYHARDLVINRSDGLATFMSVFPQGYGDGLDGMPIGGMEYVAPTTDGDLYILAMPLSKVRSYHSYIAITLPPHPPQSR